MAKKKDKVRVAIVGIGNCANALVQGLQFYKDAALDEEIPGLMHATVGGYHVIDIEISAAFDVVASKVGKDLSEAIWAEPNNTFSQANGPLMSGVDYFGYPDQYDLFKLLLQGPGTITVPNETVDRDKV